MKKLLIILILTLSTIISYSQYDDKKIDDDSDDKEHEGHDHYHDDNDHDDPNAPIDSGICLLVVGSLALAAGLIRTKRND